MMRHAMDPDSGTEHDLSDPETPEGAEHDMDLISDPETPEGAEHDMDPISDPVLPGGDERDSHDDAFEVSDDESVDTQFYMSDDDNRKTPMQPHHIQTMMDLITELTNMKDNYTWFNDYQIDADSNIQEWLSDMTVLYSRVQATLLSGTTDINKEIVDARSKLTDLKMRIQILRGDDDVEHDDDDDKKDSDASDNADDDKEVIIIHDSDDD